MTEHKFRQQFVFTDLDGTLLDHATYSHEPARSMLAKLCHMKVPVIPTTSKTSTKRCTTIVYCHALPHYSAS